MYNLLLQVKWQGFGGGNGGPAPTSASTYIIVGSVFGGIVLIALFARLISRRSGKNKGKKFSRRAFRKACRKIGLADGHTNILLQLIRENDVANGFRLLENSSILNSLLQKALVETDDTDLPQEKKEAKKLAIYRIKQIIEKNSFGKNSTITSRTLRKGTKLVLHFENGRLPSRVAANLKDALQITAPLSNSGKVVTVPRWTKVTVQFWKNEGEMYVFQTKVMSIKNLKGNTYYLLQHSKQVQMKQQRKYRRRAMEKPAYFNPVSVITTGKGKNRKREAIVNEQARSLGTVVDISAGGCGMRTNYPLKQGSLIKMQFETERKNRIIAYGKVKSLQKNSPSGTVMHIQFNNLTRQNINKINEFVYQDLSPSQQFS